LTEASVKEIPVARAIAQRFPRSRAPERRAYSVVPSERPAGLPQVWLKSDSVPALQEKLRGTKLRPDVVLLNLSEDSLNEIHMSRPHLESLGGAKRPLLAVAVDKMWTEDERLKKRILAHVDVLVSADPALKMFEGRPVFSLMPGRSQLKSCSNIEPNRSVLAWSFEGAPDDLVIDAALEAGVPFVDMPLSGLLIDIADPSRSLDLAFGILQATRRRMSKTEYISCPSCGRTLFDLEETTARIKAVTSHLTGVKIAVMGCIVNGPGEMADADFGYVGGAPGRVNLYVGKDCVERNIPSSEAPHRLVDLIKKYDRWIEPSV